MLCFIFIPRQTHVANYRHKIITLNVYAWFYFTVATPALDITGTPLGREGGKKSLDDNSVWRWLRIRAPNFPLECTATIKYWEKVGLSIGINIDCCTINYTTTRQGSIWKIESRWYGPSRVWKVKESFRVGFKCSYCTYAAYRCWVAANSWYLHMLKPSRVGVSRVKAWYHNVQHKFFDSCWPGNWPNMIYDVQRVKREHNGLSSL